MEASGPVGGEPWLPVLRSHLVDWRPDLVGTLLFLVEKGQVLLIHKRRGHGAGRINGPGGKPLPGEDALACALRETHEETGVRVTDASLQAVLRFIDRDGEDWLGFVFVATAGEGVPAITDEAIPEWFPLDALPLDRMWPDDALWLARVLAGERLAGDFLFASGVLLAWQIGPLDSATVADAERSIDSAGSRAGADDGNRTPADGCA